MTQIDFMLYFLIGHFCSEFMFQSEHMITNKWKSNISGYLACFEHTLLYTVVTLFFVLTFTEAKLDAYVIAAVFIPHFLVDKYVLATSYLVFIKRLLAPLTIKLAIDLNNDDADNKMTPQQTMNYVEKWQNDLKLDEDTFLGSIFYVIEFYAVDHILHIVPTFFILKYYWGL